MIWSRRRHIFLLDFLLLVLLPLLFLLLLLVLDICENLGEVEFAVGCECRAQTHNLKTALVTI